MVLGRIGCAVLLLLRRRIPMAVGAIVMGVKGRQRAQMSWPARRGAHSRTRMLRIAAIVLGFLWILAFLALAAESTAL